MFYFADLVSSYFIGVMHLQECITDTGIGTAVRTAHICKYFHQYWIIRTWFGNFCFKQCIPSQKWYRFVFQAMHTVPKMVPVRHYQESTLVHKNEDLEETLIRMCICKKQWTCLFIIIELWKEWRIIEGSPIVHEGVNGNKRHLRWYCWRDIELKHSLFISQTINVF
jgi:hypothetical protein